MSTFTIKSRNHGVINFFMNNAGGYVYVGDYGNQICNGGSYMGNTISATPETFEAVCRKWHKQRLAVVREYGVGYY